ncbi:MAG: metallophosphoesterase family protein [Chloroflexota bacterium]
MAIHSDSSQAQTSERRAAWLTDIHLEFLKRPQLDLFLEKVAAYQPDVLLITGDIGQASTVERLLTYIAHKLLTPICFVLGNHDYYGGDIDAVRQNVTRITHERRGIVWLPAAGVVELAPGVGLVGHDGWADGGYGDFMRSPVQLNDYVKIAQLHTSDKAALLERLRGLGAQAGDYLRGMLPEAARHYPRVYVLTHAPPFREACWYQGRIPGWNDPYLPHFTCKATGDALLATAQAFPQTHFTVLCGHVHFSGKAQLLPNLTVLTGGAEYGKPAVQQVFTFHYVADT